MQAWAVRVPAQSRVAAPDRPLSLLPATDTHHR